MKASSENILKAVSTLIDTQEKRIEELEAKVADWADNSEKNWAAAQLFRKERDELQSRIEACKPFLKDGETPAECIQRNRDDAGAVLKLLAKEKRKCEELEVSTIHDKYVSAMKRIEELEQHVCDECSPDDYGWNYNAVEGRVPCACIIESGAYQELEAENEKLNIALTDSVVRDVEMMQLQSRIEAALKLADELVDEYRRGGMSIQMQDAIDRFRKTLGADDG